MTKFWRVSLCSLLILATLVPMAGCNSRASQMEELKRRSLRRPKDDEDDNEQVAQKPKAKEKGEEPKKKQDAPKSKAAEPKGPTKDPRAQPKVAVEARPKRPVPTSSADQRSWALQSMQEIALAFVQISKERNVFPRPAILDAAEAPLLSWRVEILPYLGHQELYDRFALDEPWDSPHNLALLKEIPDVYKSPERGDEKTNFMAPFGNSTLFNPAYEYVRNSRIEDGLNNTIVLLEVDDALAIEWTKPGDFRVTRDPRGIGTKRADGVFVAFGNGMVRRVPTTIKPREFIGLMTIDGGEPLSMAKLTFPVAGDPTKATELDNNPYANLAGLGGLGASMNEGGDGDSASDPNAAMEEAEIPEIDDRPEVPVETSLAETRKVFREIYGPRYKDANTKEGKVDLANELFNKARSVGEDLNGQYIMLQAARVVAMEARDYGLTEKVIQELARSFKLDAHPLMVELFKTMGTKLPEAGIETAKEVVEIAVKRDDYESASEIVRYAVAAARGEDDRNDRGDNRTGRRVFGGPKPKRDSTRRVDDRDVEKSVDEELVELRRRVEAGRSEYRRFTSALENVEQESPEGFTVIGRYLCLTKEEWRKGLPLLAKCSDPELKHLAELELTEYPTPAQQLEIAEAWFKYGKELQPHQRHTIWKHAAMWFAASFNNLPDGLLRVKAEARLNEIERDLGNEEIAKIRARLTPSRGRTSKTALDPGVRNRRNRRDDDDD